jgi:hypothetical protein
MGLAVGANDPYQAGHAGSTIEHWDGTNWTRMLAPGLGGHQHSGQCGRQLRPQRLGGGQVQRRYPRYDLRRALLIAVAIGAGQEMGAELAMLTGHAVALGISWPVSRR